jgi:hypothetical protein
MSSISEIPLRVNGQTIFATWFNTIRTSLLLLLGNESLSQTSFSGLASQTGVTVTGLIFDKTVTRKAEVSYTIVTSTKVESGNFVLLYNGTIWLKNDGPVQGVDSLISLGVNTSTGQVEYTSGAETFTLNFKANTFNI